MDSAESLLRPGPGSISRSEQAARRCREQRALARREQPADFAELEGADSLPRPCINFRVEDFTGSGGGIVNGSKESRIAAPECSDVLLPQRVRRPGIPFIFGSPDAVGRACVQRLALLHHS